MTQRAIMVDPFERSVHEIWHDFGSDEGALLGQYLAAGDAGPASVAPRHGPTLAADVWFYIAEEAAAPPDAARWLLGGGSEPIKGRGILCQHRDGAIVGLSHTIQPSMLAPLVTFLDRNEAGS